MQRDVRRMIRRRRGRADRLAGVCSCVDDDECERTVPLLLVVVVVVGLFICLEEDILLLRLLLRLLRRVVVLVDADIDLLVDERFDNRVSIV